MNIFSIARLTIMTYPNFSIKLKSGFKIFNKLYPGRIKIIKKPSIKLIGCKTIENKVIKAINAAGAMQTATIKLKRVGKIFTISQPLGAPEAH